MAILDAIWTAQNPPPKTVTDQLTPMHVVCHFACVAKDYLRLIHGVFNPPQKSLTIETPMVSVSLIVNFTYHHQSAFHRNAPDGV